jgi:hypothetical protein
VLLQLIGEPDQLIQQFDQMGAGSYQLIRVLDQLERCFFHMDMVLLQIERESLQMIGEPDRLKRGFWEAGEVSEPLIKQNLMITLRLSGVNYREKGIGQCRQATVIIFWE